MWWLSRSQRWCIVVRLLRREDGVFKWPVHRMQRLGISWEWQIVRRVRHRCMVNMPGLITKYCEAIMRRVGLRCPSRVRQLRTVNTLD